LLLVVVGVALMMLAVVEQVDLELLQDIQ